MKYLILITIILLCSACGAQQATEMPNVTETLALPSTSTEAATSVPDTETPVPSSPTTDPFAKPTPANWPCKDIVYRYTGICRDSRNGLVSYQGNEHNTENYVLANIYAEVTDTNLNVHVDVQYVDQTDQFGGLRPQCSVGGSPVPNPGHQGFWLSTVQGPIGVFCDTVGWLGYDISGTITLDLTSYLVITPSPTPPPTSTPVPSATTASQ